jgi:hypothetical protein
MLFALVLNPLQIACVVLAVLVIALGVPYLFRIDDKVEQRRKMAGDLAGVLREEGFDQCSNVATCYSVGDYSGFFQGLRHLVQQLLNPETRTVLLAKPFEKQLSNALKDPEKLLALKKRVDAALAAKSPTTAPTTGA